MFEAMFTVEVLNASDQHFTWQKWDICCVSIQGLHPAEATFEGQLRHNAAQRLSQFKGSSKCSPQMQPSSPSFWRMHHYYPSWPHISQDSFACPKKKRESAKMATLCGVDHHFGRPGRQILLHKGKTSGDARPSHLMRQLTRSLQRTRLRRPQRPGPSKDADPELRHSNNWWCRQCMDGTLRDNNRK